MAELEKYFDNREGFLKRLYKEGRDFWETDRKDWYQENYAHANDQSPLLDLIEEGGFAPYIPILSPAIETRLASIESLQSQGEENYQIEPYVQPEGDAKALIEEKIERVKVRIEFAKRMTRFRDKMQGWRNNAEIYPAAFLYGMVTEVKKDFPEEVLAGFDEYGEPIGQIEFKPTTVYVGPDCKVLQPEQVLWDQDAEEISVEGCRYIGLRDWKDADYILSKYQQDINGEPLTREMLVGAESENEDKREGEEEAGYPHTKKEKGVELVTLWFRILDDTPTEESPEPSNSLRIRCVIFLPAAHTERGDSVVVLKDGWTPYKGEIADVYPFFAICAHDRPNRVEGRSTVDIGKPLQNEVNDSVRMRFEALARGIYNTEITEDDNVIFPTDRKARPNERIVVRRKDGFDVVSQPLPNIGPMVNEQKMLHEIALNAMAADAALPPVSTTEGGDETATFTNRREALYNTRLGRTFDNYAEGERRVIEWYFHVIKQQYVEGKQAEFEFRLFGPAGQEDFTVEDLMLDLQFKVEPFSVIAKRDVDKVLSAEALQLILPILSKGPGAVTAADIILIEDWWRAQRKPEKRLQELLKPYKDALAAVQAFQTATGGLPIGPTPPPQPAPGQPPQKAAA